MDEHASVGRRHALKVFGTCVATASVAPGAVFALDRHPLVPQSPTGTWSPRLLGPHEVETVATLADLIIPTTDTPGARAAKVHEYIDYVLSKEPTAAQQRFRDGLAWIDRYSQTRSGRQFASLAAADQTAILASLSQPDTAAPPDPAGVAFFADVKHRTIDGYYSSEIGMRQELQYRGTQWLRQFEGCTHSEHQSWQPPKSGE